MTRRQEAETGLIARLAAALAMAALIWMGYEVWTLRDLGRALERPPATRGGLSLQLAPTTAAAAEIRSAWRCEPPSEGCTDVTDVARATLVRDTRLIASYTVALVLVVLWAAWTTHTSRRLTAGVLLLIVFGAICDLAENWFLAIPLGSADALPFARIAALGPAWWRAYASTPVPDGQFAHAVTLARVAAMSKFVFLLLAAVGAIAFAGGAVRLLLLRLRGQSGVDVVPTPELLRLPQDSLELGAFRTLITRENDGIFTAPASRAADVPVLADNVAADEPRVLFRAADVIGLALSGGGIRSATFNLGLLEGLHRLNLLPLFDYVSTVSGGGYIGSFWSEWLARQKSKGDPIPPDRLFPSHRDAGSGPQDRVDTAQERHLREFSGFLAPRWGIFEVEMWTALVALVSGLLPALATGLAVIGVVLVGWLSLTFSLAYRTPWAPVPFIVGITLGTLYLFERMWHEVKTASAGHMRGGAEQAGRLQRGISRYRLVGVTALLLIAALQVVVPSAYRMASPFALPVMVQGHWQEAPGSGAFDQWWSVAGIRARTGDWVFSPHLFDFAMVWVAAAVLMVAARLLYALWPYIAARESLAAYDRVLMRIMGLALMWSGLALLWHLAVNIQSLTRTIVAAAVSGGIFAALRNWIGVALRRPSEPGILDRLKPYLPQLLAYLTIVLAAAAVGRLLIDFGGTDWVRWYIATAVMFALILVTLFINPSEYGLHAFYRERISRAYAGACNIAEGQGASQNRSTEPMSGDDRRLAMLVGRPLHLVCCAANDLSGDPVETLSRGSRSAVLSKHGFSLGRHWAPVDNLRLGSTVTASAAAFNSNMGRISMEVGPAVSFLMTALNLRLGLWIRHPAAAREGPRRWPGLMLYREMLGLTSASGPVSGQGEVPRLMRDIHLSDGGHFENLALYELVRRHCRYILMSDCGADPTVAFDDLGNALRRVREDFGVDITLDVEPLRPGAGGWSRQHIAAGTIHYSPTDRGILLYVKPALTGDEPPDVLQYKTRNTAFPHESTGDQFYDEAQWEAYRRLGLHAAESIFQFVPPAGEPASGAGAVSKRKRATERPLTADWVFAEATHAWVTTPEGLVDRILEMTKRFGDLEAELQQRLPSRGILSEVFPEIAALPEDMRVAAVAHDAKEPPREPDGGPDRRLAAVGFASEAETNIASDLSCLLRVTQLMEDVWMSCRLDEWWGHPLNLGWVNLFARWATAPSFRFWWPLLGPMFSPGFRKFLDERFPTPPAAGGAGNEFFSVAIPQRGHVAPLAEDAPEGLAEIWWKRRSAQPRRLTGKVRYQNLLDLRRKDGGTVAMQVGIVALTVREAHVGWTSDDFFVPPSLWGAGIGWYFLDNLLNELSARHTDCYVVVKAPPIDAQHQVALDDRRSFIEQYRKIGFREQLPGAPDPNQALDQELTAALGFEPGADTLLVLDLEQWARRRGR